jgi:hypothetical protein
MLTALHGLERHLAFDIEGERVLATFDDEQFNEARISSVQFVRFSVSDAQVAALCDIRRAVALVVDHPAYAAREVLGGAARGALAADVLETRE